MFKLKPKEDKFYVMLSSAAKNVNNAAIVFRKSLDCLDNKEESVKKAEEYESKGDELVIDVIKELNEAFITPIDREDIYEIIKVMDNILDLISSISHRFIMFNINTITEETKVVSDLLVDVTNQLVILMNEIPKKDDKNNKIAEALTKISRIEENADILFREYVTELFKNETDPINIMKWKEVYQIIENTIDECKKVATVVEGVVIKNA